MKNCSKCGILQEDCEYVYGKSKKNFCKSCNRQACKNYKANNKDKIKEYNKKYRVDKKEEIKISRSKYDKENREKIQKRQNIQHKERRKIDPFFRLRSNLGKRIYKLINIRKDRKSYKEFIGCSIQEVRDWIEYNFYGDMSWDNYGSVWHIDHVIPCTKFNIENDTEIKVCCNWSNLQPLLSKHNISKNNSLYWIELLNHEIKLRYYSKKFNMNSNLYLEFLKNFKNINTLYERNRARMLLISG